MKLMHMPIDVIATNIVFCHIHATQYFVSLLSSVVRPISPIADIASGAKVTCNCNCNVLLYLCYTFSLARLCCSQGRTHIVMVNHSKFEDDPRRVVLF